MMNEEYLAGLAAFGAICVAYVYPRLAHAVVGSLVGRIMSLLGIVVLSLKNFSLGMLALLVFVAFIAISNGRGLADRIQEVMGPRLSKHFEGSLEASIIADPPQHALPVDLYPPFRTDIYAAF